MPIIRNNYNRMRKMRILTNGNTERDYSDHNYKNEDNENAF